MSYQTHCIVGISVEWQLNNAYYFLFSRISEILILIIIFLVSRIQNQQFCYFSTIGWTKTRFFTYFHVIFEHAPKFNFIMFVYSQQNILLKHVNRIPYTSSRKTLLFYLENRFQFQSVVLCLSFLLLTSCNHIVLCHFHVLTN